MRAGLKEGRAPKNSHLPTVKEKTPESPLDSKEKTPESPLDTKEITPESPLDSKEITPESPLDSKITPAMNMNLGELRETGRGREAWRAAAHGVAKRWTRLDNTRLTSTRSGVLSLRWMEAGPARGGPREPPTFTRLVFTFPSHRQEN